MNVIDIRCWPDDNGPHQVRPVIALRPSTFHNFTYLRDTYWPDRYPGEWMDPDLGPYTTAMLRRSFGATDSAYVYRPIELATQYAEGAIGMAKKLPAGEVLELAERMMLAWGELFEQAQKTLKGGG